ncbi:hypothetical protein LOC67_18525 [Stieleria sp. JC731]|uniref:hypothetical protein n=1 Tax=Pirellulaceae TaxID=2691357 RepID=UPI001E495ECA|nr:hypothetical protein [Stieleria sp. JC731]MCC9602551.1 hypothetical protein [Stieleria sp. JC731]
MDSSIVLIDDKHVPLYRIVWVADLPHFCGEEECQVEGEYEVRLESNESLFTTQKGRDDVVAALTRWCGDPIDDDEDLEGEP